MCSTGSLKTLNFFWFCQVLSGVAMGTHRERFSSFFHPFLLSFLFCSFFFVCVCVWTKKRKNRETHPTSKCYDFIHLSNTVDFRYGINNCKPNIKTK